MFRWPLTRVVVGFRRPTGARLPLRYGTGRRHRAQKKIHGAAASAAERCDICEKILLPVCRSWREHRPVYGPSIGISIERGKAELVKTASRSIPRPDSGPSHSRHCRFWYGPTYLQPLCRSRREPRNAGFWLCIGRLNSELATRDAFIRNKMAARRPTNHGWKYSSVLTFT